MKLSLLFSLLLQISSTYADYSVDSSVYKNSDHEFISHRGSGPYGSYLTMEITYEPVEKLWRDIESKEGIKLKNRGEAHITVITPVEFNKVLSKKVSIAEIDKIALEQRIQSSKFHIECLGRFKKKMESGEEMTFFAVVTSKDLMSIRKKVEDLYLEKGGHKGSFRASKFYPHITVGFSKRDLHESDGAIKDKRACFKDIK